MSNMLGSRTLLLLLLLLGASLGPVFSLVCVWFLFCPARKGDFGGGQGAISSEMRFQLIISSHSGSVIERAGKLAHTPCYNIHIRYSVHVNTRPAGRVIPF